MQKTERKMGVAKKVSLAVAVVTLAAVLLAGTFAWTASFNKVNEFTGQKTDVTLHDDFDPDIGQKDVYVENTGNKPVLVRMKLEEFMDLTSNEAPVDPEWETHLYECEDPADCEEKNEAEALYHDYFQWTLGGQKYYMPADGTDKVVQDTEVYDNTTPGAMETPLGTLMSMADYWNADFDDDRDAYIGWIYDTDGFVYWSQPLESGDATGLLLSKVIPLSSALEDYDYYYAVNVIVESVDIIDVAMWTVAGETEGKGSPSVDTSVEDLYDVASDEAIDLINLLVEKMAAVTAAP